MKQYRLPIILLIVFEIVAVTLWLTKDNLFYLFNFSYIGLSISLGLFLFIKKYKYARRIVQLLVGGYMLIYLGLICQENMQIEGICRYVASIDRAESINFLYRLRQRLIRRCVFCNPLHHHLAHGEHGPPTTSRIIVGRAANGQSLKINGSVQLVCAGRATGNTLMINRLDGGRHP